MRAKNPWRAIEDELLEQAVAKYGPKRWSLIASLVPNRTSKQCCERWHAYLRPGINRGDWTPEEDRIVENLIDRFGCRWSLIASHLPGRTDVAIKNRFRAYLTTKISPKNSKRLSDFSDTSDIDVKPLSLSHSAFSVNLARTATQFHAFPSFDSCPSGNTLSHLPMISPPPSLASFPTFESLNSAPRCLAQNQGINTSILPPLSSFFVL
eukprot:c9934_g1_i1.p1 GENE.c9934_g1_i1~~c9934_g1_i1.p1  ORF type:complete len:231 (+),score=5.36 c9934_g1_i1:68-694(+)